MTRRNLPYLFLLILFISIIACQKGIHWEFDSEGNLLKDSAGNCMPVVVAGSFMINKPTNDSNFLMVSVDVIAAGNYTITTDSANGFMFKATGVFNNVGVTTVKLACSGIPLTSGTSYFNIHYNSSVCEADVNVLADTIPAADYTLQGSPNTCMNDTVRGSYLPTVALDTSNNIIISVDVITPGKYSISTNTVNGYSFSGNGVFTTTGIQSVIINGKGTPLKSGKDVFIVNANDNICSFSVDVSAIVQTSNPLHFPLTAGSYWTYKDFVAFDTVTRYVNGDTLINDTDFVRVSNNRKYNPENLFFNYNGADYNEFGKVEHNSDLITYVPSVYGQLPFLKEYTNAGASWQSQNFSGTDPYVVDNQILSFQSTYKCISNMATKEVNGFGFKNIIVIAVYSNVVSNIYGSWGNAAEIFYNYYAKGVGLICIEESVDNGVTVFPVLQILNWKVN